MEKEIEYKEIIIKRIPGKNMFSGMGAYDKSVTSIGCELSSKDGRLKTGLTKEDQARFESELNLPKGTLSASAENTWWGENININLDNTKSNRFIIDGPMSELRYRVLLESSKVANSELDKHKNPNARFYIVDDEAKAQVETANADSKFEAMELLMKLNVEERRAALRLFGKKGVDGLSETVIKNELLKQIEKDSKDFTSILSDKRLKVRMIAEELVDYGIIIKSGHYYKNGDDTIASSTDELIDYLEDLKNQSVLIAMKSRLNKFKKK